MGDAELGARLKKAREGKGLKQSEACEALGIPKVQTLSAYERGVNAPPIETIKKLAVLYNVTTDWLFFGTEKVQITSKTPYDYISEIVDGVEGLGLIITTETDGKNNPFSLAGSFICVSNIHYPKLCLFAREWSDLQNLKNNGTISEDDYDTLIKKRLEKLLDMKREKIGNPFDYDNSEMPF